MKTKVAYTPAILRILDAIPQLVKEYPMAAAGTLGTFLGAEDMKDYMEQNKNELIREQMGSLASKYSEDLNRFSQKKTKLAAKLPLLKKEAFNSAVLQESMGAGAGKGIATEGLGAVRRLIGVTAQTMRERLFRDKKRSAIFQSAVETDPTVAYYDQQNPEVLPRAYETMVRFAPELSTDPNIVVSFLRHAAMTGGTLDYATVKGLADAESSVHKAKNEGAWLRGGW